MDDFDLDIDFDFEDENKIITPLRVKSRTDSFINYDNAEAMARAFNLKRGTRHFAFVSGNFVFGDLIEALLVVKNWKVSEMIISTLSMGEENIYNLRNIMAGGYVNKLKLIVSDYFYAHERTGLVKKIYETLVMDNCQFQLAVARSHAKTCIFEVTNANHGYVVMQTSANLRSSDNIEQNANLYRFIYDFQQKIIEKYRTINKTIEGSREDWQKLNK